MSTMFCLCAYFAFVLKRSLADSNVCIDFNTMLLRILSCNLHWMWYYIV